jgi:ATP-dependent Clp protease ATP-binding subunit ClpA
MYERMTIQARWLVQRALADARRLAHRRMGSEHLLLALVAAEGPTAILFHARGATPERVEEEVTRLAAEPGGIEADRDVLAAIGIDLDEVRARVEAAFGVGALDRGSTRRPLLFVGRRRAAWLCEQVRPPVGRDAQAVLESSLRVSLARGERHVGLEHVGLALLARSGDGVAMVLDRLGVRSDELAGAIVDRYPPRRQPRRVWGGRPRGGR